LFSDGARLGWCVPFLQKIKKKLKCEYIKVIADRLADLIGESLNHFGEPERAHRRDWRNNEKKTTIGRIIWRARSTTFGEQDVSAESDSATGSQGCR